MGILIEYSIFILIILFTHLLTLSTQAISSNQYFYGVYVKNIDLEENIKSEIDKKFKKNLNVTLLLIIILYLLFRFIFNLNMGLNIMKCTIIYLIFYYIYLKSAYKKVKEIKNNYLSNNKQDTLQNNIHNQIEMDKELLILKEKLNKKFKVLFGICIGLSLLSFLYVLVNYNNMPDTIITHWGILGEPDGFSEKNILSVFFVNMIDLSMVIIFSVMGVATVSSKTYIDNNNLAMNRKKAIKYLNGLGYSFLLLTLSVQSITTVIPIFMVQEKEIPLILTLSGCIVPIFISIALVYFYMMLSTLKPKGKSNYYIENDDDKWIYGFIYYNKDDKSLMVEKRLGAGWSFNMANPMGKVITIILLLTVVLSLVICFI